MKNLENKENSEIEAKEILEMLYDCLMLNKPFALITIDKKDDSGLYVGQRSMDHFIDVIKVMNNEMDMLIKERPIEGKKLLEFFNETDLKNLGCVH